MLFVFLLLVIGFFDQDFRGEERANPHLLIVGILSGPLLDNFGLVGVTSSIGSGPNSASKFLLNN